MQGQRQFQWKTSKVIELEVAVLESLFQKVIFFAEDIQGSMDRWKFVLVGKILGRGFPIDFVEREMRARWQVTRDFHISAFQYLIT